MRTVRRPISLPSTPGHNGTVDYFILTFAGSESPLSKWNDETNSESLVELWRKSQISRELERLLSSQDLSIESKKRRLDSNVPILNTPSSNDGSAQPPYQYQQARNGPPLSQKPIWSEKVFDKRLTNDFRGSPKLASSYEVGPNPTPIILWSLESFQRETDP